MESSAKFMKLMLCSQVSKVKHSMRQLWLNLVPLEQPISAMFAQFLQPYQPQANQKGLKVTLKFNNEIPWNLCSDWQLYSEILFHILQNAIKFS